MSAPLHYVYNPLTGTFDLTGGSGGSSGISSVTATDAGSSVSFDTTGTVANLEVTDANFNTIIGESSGNGTLSGSDNVSLGYFNFVNLTTGVQNTAVGNNALGLITTGTTNTAVGKGALGSNSTGIDNTALGQLALALNLGSGNTALGTLSLQTYTGSDNTAVGFASGSFTSSGTENTYIGFQSGDKITTGSGNTLLGYHSGYNLTLADSNNVIIGNQANTGDSNKTIIGNTQTYCQVAGIAGVTTLNSEIVTIDTSTGQLGSVAGSGFITITGTLTSPEIKNLRANPVVIVPAPGNGSMIRIISFTSKLNYGGSNVFVGASQSITLYPEANNTNALATLATSAIVTSASTQYFLGSPTALSGVSTIFENLGIQISINNATEISGNASNDNTFTYSVTYQVVSI